MRAKTRTLLPAVIAAALVGLAASPVAHAQDAADDFRKTCTSCHTIGGGRLTGPDLKNVLERRDRDWVVSFVMDPAAKLDGGDPIAAQLLAEANGVRMPTQPGMTRARAQALVDLIEAESALAESRFKGVTLSDRPLTAADVVRGREIFLGRARLASGGPPCISCHTVGGIGGLGGGRLGPDLTKVFERYTDRKILASWLSAPATPTMGSLFANRGLAPEEILPLVAYFQETARTREEDSSPHAVVFLLLALFGAGGSLGLFARLWRNRFRAVRRPLVTLSRGNG